MQLCGKKSVEKLVEKSMEKSAQKSVDKSVEKSEEKSVEKSAQKYLCICVFARQTPRNIVFETIFVYLCICTSDTLEYCF